eukprot:TRINITY_DN3604_c0_g1_i2.p1 TRINITY_DN3604_c0_g1~~TRINITY_DN3604_c0_g1_i2.p1  ORF type:complete len:252 (+),score=54.19 TRINITY_DN3604_c0_g1_i2:144-899(+)
MGASPSTERRQQEYNGPQREYLWKVVVVGEVGTGKTSVVRRLVHDTFLSDYRPTKAVDFIYQEHKPAPHAFCKIQIWDIAGKERYGKFTRVYYEGSVAAVVVADLSKNGFMEGLKGAAVWATDISTKVVLTDSVPLPMILLINKMDSMSGDLESMRPHLDAFAREHGFYGWWFCSAKEGTNVHKPIATLLNKVVRLAGKVPIIDSTEVHEIAEEHAPAPSASSSASSSSTSASASSGPRGRTIETSATARS